MVFAWCAAVGSVACGGAKKEATDPSSEGSAYADDTPKWEGASRREPEAPAATGPAPVERGNRRSDEYDKEATEVVLKRAARQVKENCGAAKDENGKAVGPWGNIVVQVALGANGRSKGTTVPTAFQGKPTGNCVEKAFTNLTFPPWAGSDMLLDWEVELLEPEAP